MRNLYWYIYRIRKISIREYPYRINQLAKKRIDKFFLKKDSFGYYTSNIDIGENINKTDISGLEKNFPQVRSQMNGVLENILKHRFNIFGIEKEFNNPINWNLDPKTDNSWPLMFWGDINYRNGKTIGSIKFAWEINRFHHFPLLAIAFSLTKEAKYKQEIFNQLESWLESNPYPKGINWIMGIELGIRIVNIIYALKFLGNDMLSPSQQRLVVKFIILHGKHLYRYPSKHSSCANHAIAEALGMFVAGICFPDYQEAKKWKKYGKELLEREATRQIYPDGSNFEHSLHYLQFILDHYLIYYLLCKEHREPCSEKVINRLKASFNFISKILDKNGNYPHIGDDDDGYLLKLWFEEQNNFISLLNSGAILFDNPEWILENANYDEKTYLLLGEDSKLKWRELHKRKKANHINNQYFQNAGLAIIRDKDSSEILFVGNSGPLGLKPYGGHGHADALSFWLSVDGKPLIIDPGTYLYHGGGEWRNYFRSTSAHNTIRIDERDQSDMARDFIFKNFYKIINASLKQNEEDYLWSAGHDGYMRLKDPVFHKREVIYIQKEKLLLIKDFLYCKKKHFVECYYHFHPDISLLNEPPFFLIECGNVKIRIQIDKKWNDIKLIKGGRSPLLGWYSPRFNRLQATYCLKLSAEINGSDFFGSKIFLN